MHEQSSIKANHAIGAIVLAIFGAVWLIAWCFQLGSLSALALVAVAAVALTLCLLGVRKFRRNRAAYFVEAKTPAGRRSARLLGFVNGAQWVFIFAAVILLSQIGQSRWRVPTVIFIVGVHFLPLAKLLHYTPYYGTAAALTFLAVAYPFVAPAGLESTVGLLGSGMILWATAAALLTANPSFKRTA